MDRVLLRRAIKRAGSGRKLAAIVGVTGSYISMILSYERTPSPNVVAKISAYLNEMADLPKPKLTKWR